MSDDDRYAWIDATLERYEPGVHRLAGPAGPDAVRAMPSGLAEFYLRHDGGELFHESLVIRAARDAKREQGSFWVAELGRDQIYVDERGAVWRLEADSGDLLHEGTRFDRWLAGYIDGESILYETDGEFVEDAVDESGEELVPAAAVERARRAHRRDRRAPGPRWRLARALIAVGEIEAARDHLEDLVAETPRFPWAWLDLSRIAEDRGDLGAACDDAVEAARCVPDYEHAPFFLATAARIAHALGDDTRRAELAAEALARDPELAARHREGAAANMIDGALEDAAALADLALALNPRDLEALELVRRIQASRDRQ